MVSSDALPIVLHEDTMRLAAAGLGPAIALECGEDVSGRGRGRTTDLPVFRTRDNSSSSNVNVRYLQRSIDLHAGERGRTQADETKDEPTIACDLDR
jgi:hypothetical protein